MNKFMSLLFVCACVTARNVPTRIRRQTGSFTTNHDGTSGLSVKVPITENEKNMLSAIGSADFNNQHKLSAASAGIALDNANGHGLTLTGSRLPGFGEQYTAAGKLNLFHNDNHDLSAKAFATRNMPNAFPNAPNFNTVGGGLDYMFKNKVGASINAAHTDLFNRNDYSVGGKLNVFRSPSSSLDFNAGFHKFQMPSFQSAWEPNAGFSFTKFF